MEQEKIFANDATDKELIPMVYKQFRQLNIKKTCKRPKQTFLQRRYTGGQQTHEQMLNVANYQRNANQNYNEVSPHTGQNGHHRKSTNNKS